MYSKKKICHIFRLIGEQFYVIETVSLPGFEITYQVRKYETGIFV